MPIPAEPTRRLLPPSPAGPADRERPLARQCPQTPADQTDRPSPPPSLTRPSGHARRTHAVPDVPAGPTGRTHPLPPPSGFDGPAHRTRRLLPPGQARRAVRARRLLPPGLTGLAALACAACCAIPLLLTAGVLSGATWAATVSWLPGTAAVLTALAAAAWWRTTHKSRCAGDTCSCSTP